MNSRDLEYYLLASQTGTPLQPAPASAPPSIEELMAQSYSIPNVAPQPPQMLENPYRQPIRQLPPAPQRTDEETLRMLSQARPQQQQGPQIPLMQKIKEHMASSGAAWSNFFRGIDPRYKNIPADPMAPYQAEASLRNQYINEQRALEALRKSQQPPDPLKRMLDIANLEKRQVETGLAQRQLERAPQKEELEDVQLEKARAEAALTGREAAQIETEADRKKAYIDTIKTLAEKFKVEIPPIDETWDIEQLERLATDFARHPLQYARARAVGGLGSGKNIAYNVEKQPKLASAVARAAESKSRFLSDPADREAYKEVMDSDMSPKQKREVIEQQGWTKEIERTQDRLYRYGEETLKKISDPNNGVAEMFKSIEELRMKLDKYPSVPGWNAISSTANSFGKLGQWIVDLKNYSDPAARDIMVSVRRYNEAYRRVYSGAAIADHEKADFAGQLGAGAFSSPGALKQGVNNAERSLRKGIEHTISTIDERVRPEYSERAKEYLPKSYTPQSNDDAFGDL